MKKAKLEIITHINQPNIIIGYYTDYDDPDNIENFFKNVLYQFDFVGDKYFTFGKQSAPNSSIVVDCIISES